MADSTFLDTYNALVAACVAAPAFANVAVADGSVTERGAELQRLFIGTSADGLSAEGDNPESSIPGVIDNEIFSILCVAETWGDTMPNCRIQAFALRGAVRGLVRPNSSGVTLGVSSLASARVGQWTLEQDQTPKGVYVGITFRVECVSKPSTN